MAAVRRNWIAETLDPHFQPAILVNRAYRAQVQAARQTERFYLAVERNDSLVHRSELTLLPGAGAATLQYVERHVKFLLWSVGGFRLHVCGPAAVCQHLAKTYAAGGAREFDANLMERVYDQPMQVRIVARPEELPPAREATMAIGGHLQGCRIGFDLGASDYKLAAVREGEAVFATEIPWDPVKQADPNYHYTRINEGLKLAASKLPRVDAIGGSSAGIWVDNQVKVASLFRAVPRDRFEREVKGMFLRLQREWQVPLVVANDGDVTALAGAMSLNRKGMLGIAMGSSEAAGFLDPRGSILGWLNELAFAPVDFNPAAPPDEWSGDRGVGALYFSQQAVNKLAPAAGFTFPAEVGLPERLKAIQGKADAGDANALRIFATIGVYLAYALVHYRDYYDYADVLLLGRVTSGAGGELILDRAREVLKAEFPEFCERVTVHVPDEKSRRVGQAVAAASLPEGQPNQLAN
jgi:predicted NBD/HSP70 family sugar kinase